MHSSLDLTERVSLLPRRRATSLERDRSVSSTDWRAARPRTELFEDQADVFRRTRGRPNQQRSKMRVVQRYGGRCAICDRSVSEWLVAAHLVGDAEKGSNDPRNGLPCRLSGWSGRRECARAAELGQGLTAHFSGSVRVEFNRSFSRSQGGKHRSYSVPLRPDILVETPRERHIFDAKFAFEPFGPSVSEDDDDSEDDSLAGRARRGHIHKMHTYRDALDRVASVRVLYPGSTDEWYPVGPPGARHGVGSLPLRVGSAADASALRSLLKELIPSDTAPARGVEHEDEEPADLGTSIPPSV
jgi:PD-(D/E)XK nuclease superfamily